MYQGGNIMNEEENIIEYEEPTNNGPEIKPEPKKHSGLKLTAIYLSGALICGGAGFAGATLAMNMAGNNLTNKEVLYQSVIQTKADGSEAGNLSNQEIVEAVKNTIVEITTSSVQNNSFLQQYVSSGAGSGVIISKDGLIITNAHVIEGATDIKVRTADGTEYPAELIASDSQTDVAVIRVQANNLQAAVFGNSDSLQVGEDVLAVGNPLGSLGGTVTEGILSAKDREITVQGQTMTLLQTSAAINPGNSGGGLFNRNGELIGIINAKSTGTDIEGLGFAIPINIAKSVAEDLVEKGKVSGRLTLGISYFEVNSVQAAMQYGVNTLGLYIKEVLPDTNAARAGMQAEDVITAVDGEQITTAAELKAKLSSHKVGDTMTFTVIRDKAYVELSVVLAE